MVTLRSAFWLLVATITVLGGAAQEDEFMEDPAICKEGGEGRGYFFPALPNEHELPTVLRGFMYLVGLFYAFAGVAIIADIFMASIEKITSAERAVFLDDQIYHVQVWNGTVANLTLMALGSSAPEIILSTLEIVANDFFSGDLGPSTIVGSAAFNLLVILAVCVVAIPNGETRRIKELGVFAVTASFSIFACVWLIVILVIITPDVVDLWEGILTFLFFPILVFLAYQADRGVFNKLFSVDSDVQRANEKLIRNIESQYDIRAGEISKLDFQNMPKLVKRIKKLNPALPPDDILKIATILVTEQRKQRTRSRAFYRVNATRKLFGGRKLKSLSADEIKKVVEDDIEAHGSKKWHMNPGFAKALQAENYSGNIYPAIFTFAFESISIMEDCGTFELEVKRAGNVDLECQVQYFSESITAIEGKHYGPVRGSLKFKPGQKEASFPITIVDDDVYDEDKRFKVHLSLRESGEIRGELALGNIKTVEVTIIDDENPGVLTFSQPTYTVWESEEKVSIVVVRQGGSTGRMACQYATKDGTAIAGADYVALSGELVFEHNETTKTITIDIIDDDAAEDDETFQLILSDPEKKGNAVFRADTDGYEDREVVTITIKSDDDITSMSERVLRLLNINEDKMRLASLNWKQQFLEAVMVNGGEIDEDDPPTVGDYVTHYITLPWKLTFALCPPVDVFGGWACFVVSLGLIAVVTMMISDLASLFGCVCGLADATTAITFVALGTSLPDTFASMSAAVQDSTADASIGNITGSNSVNVFLGLGLPWLIASVYWNVNGVNDEWRGRYPDISREGFVVEAGDLGVSVGIFVGCALVCLGTLLLRRMCIGAELGGSFRFHTAALFATLWLTYIILSALQTDGQI